MDGPRQVLEGNRVRHGAPCAVWMRQSWSATSASAGRSPLTRGYRSRKSRLRSVTDTFLQLSSSMNALQDPTKKPSINSLLNPQESYVHPVGTNHGHNQSNQSSMYQYDSVPSYNLRAASWDPDEDPQRLRHQHHQHQHNQHQHAASGMSYSSALYSDDRPGISILHHHSRPRPILITHF